MEEYTDNVEFDRPEGKKVRIVFELFRNEVLFHYCEFRHDDNSQWQSIRKDDDGYFSYTITDSDGSEKTEKVLFPTPGEVRTAQDEINKKYNILSI